MPAVSTLLRPGLNDIPIVSEIFVSGNPICKVLIHARDSDQFSQVMGVARVNLDVAGRECTQSRIWCAPVRRCASAIAGLSETDL